jgi:hypothetical protein
MPLHKRGEKKVAQVNLLVILVSPPKKASICVMGVVLMFNYLQYRAQLLKPLKITLM